MITSPLVEVVQAVCHILTVGQLQIMSAGRQSLKVKYRIYLNKRPGAYLILGLFRDRLFERGSYHSRGALIRVRALIKLSPF